LHSLITSPMTTNRQSVDVVVARRLTFDGHRWTYDSLRADGSIVTRVTCANNDPAPPFVAPAPIYANIRLSGGHSRRRNGWFRAVLAEVRTWIQIGSPTEISLCVWAHREGKMAPIVLRMDPTDARALGQALTAIAAASSPAPQTS